MLLMRRALLPAWLIFFGTTLLRAVAADSQSPPAAPSDARSAGALYDAAYDRWKSLSRSAFATYVTHIEITRKSRVTKRVERIAYRRADNLCLTVGLPLDARDRPDAPSVSDRCLAPDYAFTFVPQRTPGRGGPLPLAIATPPPPSQSGEPATIGHVVVRSRPYDVAFAGNETIGGVATTHLTLRPLGDPSKHILRDLWIATGTNAVLRLHGVAPLVAVVATVDFIADYEVDPQRQTLSRVTGFAKAQVFLVSAGADFAFAQTDYAYPATLPAWYFEKNGYATHAGSLESPRPLPAP